MKSNTFPTNNENEAIALVNFFKECGYTATRKGLVVKVMGEPAIIGHLFNVFLTTALI